MGILVLELKFKHTSFITYNNVFDSLMVVFFYFFLMMLHEIAYFDKTFFILILKVGLHKCVNPNEDSPLYCKLGILTLIHMS